MKLRDVRLKIWGFEKHVVSCMIHQNRRGCSWGSSQWSNCWSFHKRFLMPKSYGPMWCQNGSQNVKCGWWIVEICHMSGKIQMRPLKAIMGTYNNFESCQVANIKEVGQLTYIHKLLGDVLSHYWYKNL
jgi:hypothetical protein